MHCWSVVVAVVVGCGTGSELGSGTGGMVRPRGMVRRLELDRMYSSGSAAVASHFGVMLGSPMAFGRVASACSIFKNTRV